MTDHRWRLIQDGMTVAGGSAPDLARRDSEMSRYAAQYAQEGPVRLEVRSGKGRWRRFTP